MKTKINIIDREHTEVTRADGGGEWDADDTYTSHSIEGISISDAEYSTLEVPYKVKKNVPYYLVYAIFSTGDSFHHEEGRIDFIDLYQKRTLAEKVARIIEEDYKKWKENFSVTIFDSTGKKFKMHCPWKGYFESLTDVRVEEVYLEK